MSDGILRVVVPLAIIFAIVLWVRHSNDQLYFQRLEQFVDDLALHAETKNDKDLQEFFLDYAPAEWKEKQERAKAKR